MLKKATLALLVLAFFFLSPSLASKNVFSCKLELGRVNVQSCYVESPVFSLGNLFSLNLGFDLTRANSSELIATLYSSLYLGLGNQWLYLDLGPSLVLDNLSANNWGELDRKSVV